MVRSKLEYCRLLVLVATDNAEANVTAEEKRVQLDYSNLENTT